MEYHKVITNPSFPALGFKLDSVKIYKTDNIFFSTSGFAIACVHLIQVDGIVNDIYPIIAS